MGQKRKYIQNLRTKGKNPPAGVIKDTGCGNHVVNTASGLTVHEGEILLSMDNDRPKLYFMKNNGEFAEFSDSERLLETQYVVAKALNEIDRKLSEQCDCSCKQDKLISGVNIKTINGKSLLGQGNLKIGDDEITAGDNIEITDERVLSAVGYHYDKENKALSLLYSRVSGSTTGIYSTTEGYGTSASHDYEHSGGRFNQDLDVLQDKPLINFGYGESGDTKSVFVVTRDGGMFAMNMSAQGTGYSEMYEWMDGFSSTDNYIGRFVSLEDGKIYPTEKLSQVIDNAGYDTIDSTDDDVVIDWNSEYVLGVTTATASMIGGNAIPSGNNPSAPLSERSDWAMVAITGSVIVRHDGTLEANGRCKSAPDGLATKSDKGGYFVIELMEDNKAVIMLK